MQRSRQVNKLERKYERFLIDIRLIVRTEAGELHGRTKNLAEGGMGATVAGDIPLNDQVELQFQMPDSSTPVVLHAEVRYRQGFQYGFRFLPLTHEKLQIIRRALESLPPET